MTVPALTTQQRRQGALAGAAAKRVRAAERGAYFAAINDIVDGFEAERIPVVAAAGSLILAVKALETDISSLDAERYARASEILFKMHRLATGQSTSNAAHAHGSVDAEVLAGRVAEAQARLAELTAGPLQGQGPEPS